MRAAWLLGSALSLVSMAAPVAEPFVAAAVSPVCSSGGSAASATVPGVILPGFGTGGMTIGAANAEAKRWFDYGLQSTWAFAHAQGLEGFKEAARIDPTCAMCAWGVALASGPTINFGISDEERAEALTIARRASALSKGAPERDRRLIRAMVIRYSRGDKAYARSMTAIAKAWPNDDEVQILAADALMIAERPKKAMPLLEAVLARNPTSTGAIHFYIHASEWVGRPGLAERYADTLDDLAPGASHLIHMPSHTFYQIGRYRDAANANLNAIKVDQATMSRPGAPPIAWKIPYYGHNVSFAMGGALMAGEADAGLDIARRYSAIPAETLKEGGSYAQRGVGSAWVAYGRFADIDAVLAMDPPDKDLPYLRAFWRYGRGEALARRGDAVAVRAEAAKMRDPGEVGKITDKNMLALVDIAYLTLIGRAAMLDKDYAAAAEAYSGAALKQERMFSEYRDPPAWWYPARRSVAAALLAQGKDKEALAESQAVLKLWPRDPMTLAVASRASASLGDQATAAANLKNAAAGWGLGDVSAMPLSLI
jgi:tetratricopeptide (TPR) repeat protein